VDLTRRAAEPEEPRRTDEHRRSKQETTMAAPTSSTGTRKDPLPSFVFKVTINGVDAPIAFFKSCGGLSYESDVQEMKQGGVNHTTHKLVGPSKWKNITLKMGFTADSAMLKWKDDWTKFAATGESFPGRKDGKIEQLDTQLNVVKTWNFKGGWPVKWELTEFDASKSELAIETLEIAHEGLTVG
jgi:phage tail-like protein